VAAAGQVAEQLGRQLGLVQKKALEELDHALDRCERRRR
jgi:hypothetical protein